MVLPSGEVHVALIVLEDCVDNDEVIYSTKLHVIATSSVFDLIKKKDWEEFPLMRVNA